MSTINVLDATGATVAVNTPNADGQATMANSRSVVIASDQSAVAVAPNITRGAGNVDANTQRVTMASDGVLATATGATTSAAAPADGTGNYDLIAANKRNLLNGAAMLARTPVLGQAAMAASSPVVIASDQSVVPVNQAGVSASGTVTTLNANLTSGVPTANSTVSLNLTGSSGFAVDIRGTWTGTIQFQGSIDNSNWFTLASIPAGSGPNVASVTSTTANGAWIGNASGLIAVRATVSASPTGTATITLRAMQATGLTFNLPSGQTTQPVSGTVTVGTLPAIVGQAAHDAVIAGAPVRLGGRAITANYAAVASGDVADLVTTLVGALVQKPFAIPELDWTNTQALTTATASLAKAAAGAGIRNYVTACQFSNSGGAAVDVIILDGVTEIWRATVAPNGFVDAVFQTPLRSAANAAINVNLSAVGTVRANTQGYAAP